MRGHRTCSSHTRERHHDDTATDRDAIDILLDDPSAGRTFDQPQIEVAIMALLLSDEHQGPWTRSEIEREIGTDAITAGDALVALHASGLVHLHGELMIASRAARRMDELGV